MSNSLRPHGLQPTRLLCPWVSPGKNTAVGCPPPGGLPDPGTEPAAPALQADSLPSEPPGSMTGLEGFYWKLKQRQACHTVPKGDTQAGWTAGSDHVTGLPSLSQENTGPSAEADVHAVGGAPSDSRDTHCSQQTGRYSRQHCWPHPPRATSACLVPGGGLTVPQGSGTPGREALDLTNLCERPPGNSPPRTLGATLRGSHHPLPAQAAGVRATLTFPTPPGRGCQPQSHLPDLTRGERRGRLQRRDAPISPSPFIAQVLLGLAVRSWAQRQHLPPRGGRVWGLHPQDSIRWADGGVPVWGLCLGTPQPQGSE